MFRSLVFLVLALLQVHSYTIIGPNQHVYTIYPVALIWKDAMTICETSNNGHLLILNDNDEVKTAIDLFDAVQGIPSDLLHAGATDVGNGDGNFYDVMGQRIINEFWDRDQPNGDGHCVATNKYGLYDDHECSSKLYFICENLPS